MQLFRSNGLASLYLKTLQPLNENWMEKNVTSPPESDIQILMTSLDCPVFKCNYSDPINKLSLSSNWMGLETHSTIGPLKMEESWLLRGKLLQL